MTDLHELTIAEAGRRIAAKEISPVELTEAYLARIEATDRILHSYIRVLADSARAQARQAEQDIRSGGVRGPLHGVPLALKDIYETAGVPTTGHSKVLVDHVPKEDAVTTRRLKDAGSILLGKLATHEFAFGGPSFDLPFPPARNPWNPEHFTGGSSSGSGAAVAAGLCAGALGSDTAGSIRGPAAFCGIAGIKPTYGLVSRRGVLPLAYSLDHCGPMTWTAEDSAILLQAIAGHDPLDPASADVSLPDYRAACSGGIEGRRIGVVRQFHESDHQGTPDARKAFDASLNVLHGLGAELIEIKLPNIWDFHACCFANMVAEAFAIHGQDLRERPDHYGQFMRLRMMMAGLMTAEDYLAAIRMRANLKQAIDRALDGVDALVTVASFGPAPNIGGVGSFAFLDLPSLYAPFNLSGSPAMVVCNGFADNGLPLGLQIVGKAFDEPSVFRVAHAYEQATPWRQQRPRIAEPKAVAAE
jgi:aspartyl-tRNA(Asn)/glutamyl-tRNA(Gln) amidotransferase subunit A